MTVYGTLATPNSGTLGSNVKDKISYGKPFLKRLLNEPYFYFAVFSPSPSLSITVIPAEILAT